MACDVPKYFYTIVMREVLKMALYVQLPMSASCIPHYFLHLHWDLFYGLCWISSDHSFSHLTCIHWVLLTSSFSATVASNVIVCDVTDVMGSLPRTSQQTILFVCVLGCAKLTHSIS